MEKYFGLATLHGMAKRGAGGGKREIMSVEIPPDAKTVLVDLQDSLGVPQRVMTSRLFQWYAAQRPEIQSLIMRQFTQAVAGDVAKAIVERIAEMPLGPVLPIPDGQDAGKSKRRPHVITLPEGHEKRKTGS